MKVKDLKELLKEADDEMDVLIPHDMSEFTGAFLHPCVEESGVAELGIEDLDEEDIKEHKLLNKKLPSEKSFILVPCGFFSEKDHIHEHN